MMEEQKITQNQAMPVPISSTEEQWDISICPSRNWIEFPLREWWEYREVIYFLIWRNIKIRYKQTILGVAWVGIQPLLTMLVFSIFFGRLAKIPSEGIPYPLFAYTALVPWMYFSNALTRASNSLIENERLITKIYFPRIFIPAADVLSGLLDLGIALLLLVGMMFWYGITPSAAIVSIFLFILLAVIFTLAASLWTSALNVLYRDVRYAVVFLVQFWLFATPVAYPLSLVPTKWRVLYGLNPMVIVIEGFRWALLNTAPPSGMLIGVSLAVILLFIGSGLYYFRRLEDSFADKV